MVLGSLAAALTLMGCFTCGFTYIGAVPLALAGAIVACFGSGALRVGAIVLNFLALAPAAILLVLSLVGNAVDTTTLAKSDGTSPARKDTVPAIKRVTPSSPAFVPPRSSPDRPIPTQRKEVTPDSPLARIKAIGDGDDAVQAVPELMEYSQVKEAGVRLAAVKALGKIGTGANRAIPTLVRNLTDADPRVKLAAIEALAAVGTPTRDELEGLKAAADDPEPQVRSFVAETMGRIKWADDKDAVIAVLLKLTGDMERPVRIAALKSWGKVGSTPKASLTPLLENLKKTSDPAEIEACLDALAGVAPLTVVEVPVFENALQDKSPAVRLYAVNSLGKLGSEAKASIPALRRTLKDDDAAVCRAAIQALGSLGAEASAARPDLVAALKSKANKDIAADALFKIGDDAALMSTWLTLLHDGDAKVAAVAIKAIDRAKKPAKEHAKALVDSMGSPQVAVRLCAAAALGRMGPDASLYVSQLNKALDDKSVDVQASVIQALGNIGPEARLASPQLIAMLKNMALRDASFEALVKIGKGAVPDLVKALNLNEPKSPRRDIIDILGSIGPDAKDSMRVLVGITKSFDEFPATRKAALAALKKIESK